MWRLGEEHNAMIVPATDMDLLVSSLAQFLVLTVESVTLARMALEAVAVR